MSLDRVKRANKKARAQAKRRSVQKDISKKRAEIRINRKRQRKMIIEGRREFMAKRRADANYLKNLEAEIEDDRAS